MKSLISPPEILFTGIPQFKLTYNIPDHLRGIKSIEEMRDADIDQLNGQLKAKGSSIAQKIEDGQIYRTRFEGMVLDITSYRINPHDYSMTLSVSPVHPYRADLSMKRDKSFERNVTPLTISALLRTIEDKFVIGVRGGTVEAGMLTPLPSGHVDYKVKQPEDPLVGLFQEFREEAGIRYDPQRHDIGLGGLMLNTDTWGLHLFSAMNVQESSGEVVSSWMTAKDRGENAKLLVVSKNDVRDIANLGRVNIDGENYVTNPFFQRTFRNSLDFFELRDHSLV